MRYNGGKKLLDIVKLSLPPNSKVKEIVCASEKLQATQMFSKFKHDRLERTMIYMKTLT